MTARAEEGDALMKKVQSHGEEGRLGRRRPWREPALRRLSAGAAENGSGLVTEAGFGSS